MKLRLLLTIVLIDCVSTFTSQKELQNEFNEFFVTQDSLLTEAYSAKKTTSV